MTSSTLVRYVGLAVAIGVAGCVAPRDADDPGGDPPFDSTTLFDDSGVHELRLEMAPADWRAILDTPLDATYRRTTFAFDGEELGDVGVRAGGESSRFAGNAKMPLRVKFDTFVPAQRFRGVKRVNLSGMFDDPSLIRERLAYHVFRAVVPTPRDASVRLMVNGEYRGLYNVEEVWDKHALRHFYPDPLGPLYRIRKVGTDYDPYAYRGDDLRRYIPIPWEPRTNDSMATHARVPAKLALLSEDDPSSLEQVFDVDRLLAYLAAAALMANTGYLAGDSVDDHLQYFDLASDRFHVLPWDPDQSFGRDNDPPERSVFDNFGNSVVTRILRDAPTYRARYLAEIARQMDALPLDHLIAEVDRLYYQVREAAYADPNKLYPNDHFDWSAGYIKDFIARRYASLDAQVGR
jgi:spore coat protein CotH